MYIIIDGYNVIRRNPELSLKERVSLESGREGLIKLIKVYKGIKPKYNITVVFDGTRERIGESVTSHSGIKVVFADGSADDYIKAILNACKNPADYIVVSDDNDIINYARRKRVGFLKTHELIEKIQRKKTQEKETDKPIPDSNEARAITEELMNLWVGRDRE